MNRFTRCSEAATFDGNSGTRRPIASTRNDVDHTTDRVTPVEHALRSSQHLDPLDLVYAQQREIERSTRAARIVDRHAVEQYLGVLAISTSQKDRRQSALVSLAHDVEPDDAAQRFRRIAMPLPAKLVPRNNGHRTPHLIRGHGAAVRCHNLVTFEWRDGKGRASRNDRFGKDRGIGGIFAHVLVDVLSRHERRRQVLRR